MSDHCNVCGGQDTRLIDGFYYCVECGTQNTDVRETILEERALDNATFAHTNRRKIIKIRKDGIEMSGEWYKWHAYNFIISGLADRLVELGAQPTFKTKLLWIWTRYIKKYQNKSDLMMNKSSQDDNNQTALPSFMVEDNNPEKETFEDSHSKKTSRSDIVDGSKRDIKFLSKGVIVAMLYLALNLDESDIQLSHLYRFLQEKHLDILNVKRFVPSEIDMKKIPNWENFIKSKLCTQHLVRALAISLLKKLDLGTPKVPDLKKILDNFMSELSLPNDMKPFIYSLMTFRRCDFLYVDKNTLKSLIRMPDYEGTVMTFIIVALKMCFGLDCNYEIELSNVVEKINEERNLQKSFRLGKYSEPTERFFSFKEWCSHMRFKKVMLGKHNLHIAKKHFSDIDDYVYLEQMEEGTKTKEELTDKISMEIISRLPQDYHTNAISKDLFTPTLAPISEYTDIIIDYCQDTEVKLLLAEDFTRYSLKYACENLSFIDTKFQNVITGVSENRKISSDIILGTIVTKKTKTNMVYVKNCENRNWMITNPPSMEHVTTIEEDSSHDKDCGYESEAKSKENSIEIPLNDSETNCHDLVEGDILEENNISIEENKIAIEVKRDEGIMPEEEMDKNIFDDCFEDITFKEECDRNNIDNHANENGYEVDKDQNNVFSDEDFDQRSNVSSDSLVPIFNPDTFNRDNTIKELILFACKNYKIPIPVEYRSTEPRKRKTENEPSTITKCKRVKYDGKITVNNLLSSYHTYVQSDFVNKLQREVGLAIRNYEFTDQNLQKNNDITISDALDPSLRRNSNNESELCNHDGQHDSLVTPVDEQTDLYEKTYQIDENLENMLFEADEKNDLDDLTPKGDPKFDEEKYNIEQLYIKMKDIQPESSFFDVIDDPDLDKILLKDVEPAKSEKFEHLKKQPKDIIKKKVDCDSEDETPLSEIRDEIMLMQDIYRQEQNYDRLIKNDNIPEFKYWVRHYGRDLMDRSKDSHVKFNEELKENVPPSFYFILQECSNILNCTNFYLYKQLQLLEEFFVSKSRKNQLNTQDLDKVQETT